MIDNDTGEVLPDSLKNILPAMLRAQEQIKAVVRDSDNPFFHSKYADLATVIAEAKPALNAQGIVVLQRVMGERVQTTLYHAESGERISDSYPIVCPPGDAQKFGAAVTYARRYSLKSLLCLAEEDDDANSVGSPARAVPAPVAGKGPKPEPKGMAADDAYLMGLARDAGWVKDGKVRVTSWLAGKLEVGQGDYDITGLVDAVKNPNQIASLAQWCIKRDAEKKGEAVAPAPRRARVVLGPPVVDTSVDLTGDQDLPF